VKKDGLRSEAVPSSFYRSRSDANDRNDPVIAIHGDDLIADDEVHVPAPLEMDFD
jgi:hypothetical protein